MATTSITSSGLLLSPKSLVVSMEYNTPTSLGGSPSRRSSRRSQSPSLNKNNNNNNHINSDRIRAVATATPTADNRRRRSASRNTNASPSPSMSHRTSPRNPGGVRKDVAPSDRNTKIQVCVRVRPILPSDHKRSIAPNARAASTRSPSNGSPPKPSNSKYRSQSAANIRVKMPRSSRDLLATISDGSPLETEPCWQVSNDTITQAPHTNPDAKRKHEYTFDHTFGPANTNSEMYRSTVRDTVVSSMEGYHASVFAYGQTNTGKTFTMTGAGVSNINHNYRKSINSFGNSSDTDSSMNDNDNSKGIIQNAIQECFDYIHNQKNETREYLLRVSFMEIYNEVINDLLATPSSTTTIRPTTSYSMMHSPPTPPLSAIRIFESKQEGVVIRGLKEEIVTCPEQVFALLAAGERRRQTGSTEMNKQSSRSHSIFRLIIESRQRIPRQNSGASLHNSNSDSSVADSIASSTFQPASTAGPVRVSTLSMVDLAGSESIKNTNSTGTRQKEGQYINKSLLTLGHVVYKLAELSKREERGGMAADFSTAHIPYRDSKLTRLLQPSLSGNAQICIICNVSPLAKHVEESHLTLKFASRAKRIKQNAKITEVVDEKTMLENYREEIEELKNQLKEAKDSHEEVFEAKQLQQGSTVTGNMDEDDAQVLTQAIGNLEKLILKTTTAEERKRRRKRREAAKAAAGQDIPRTISNEGHLDKDGNAATCIDPMLNMMMDDHHQREGAGELDDMLMALAMNPKSKQRLKDDLSIGSTSLGDESTIVEGKKLVTELHRIQGLLGSVLAKKGSTSTGAGSPSGGGIGIGNGVGPATPRRSNQHEGEVERLRAQLHEQAVHTSLRKADSTFLQAQLQEKDVLLRDISQILEAVEQRQLQLENENEKLKREWEKSMAALRSKESESLILEKLMKKRENEIKRLREQLGDGK